MRRKHYFPTLIACLSIGFVSPVGAQMPETCVVASVEGQANVSTGNTDSQSAVVDLELGVSSKLKTGPEARVTMTCDGGLEVVVGPETEIDVLGLIDGDTRPFGLRLIDGVAGFLFSSEDGNSVQIQTPSAVAAVRSTEWAMKVENGASAVFTREGTVSVTVDGAGAELGPGEGIDVSSSGEIGPVVNWGPARIEQLSTLLGPEW